MTFRISILIPAYNAEAFIREALDSVARETRRPDEVIIVDDGSTDGTVEAVREWMARSDLDVRLLRQDHRGASAARNTALRHARSELVNFMDADDLALRNRLETLEGAFQNNHGLVCCFSDAEVFNATGRIVQSCIAGKEIEFLSYDEQGDGLRVLIDSVYQSLLDSYCITVDSTLMSREVAVSIGGFDESFVNAEDLDFFLRLSRLGRFAYYPFALSQIRRHGRNLTHARNALRIHRNTVAVLRKMIENSDELDLCAKELRATEQAGAKQADIVLYLSSQQGLASYRNAREQLESTDFVRPKLQSRHVLRAFCYSILRSIGARDVGSM